MSLTLRRNTIAGSCQNALLVLFARFTTGLGIPSGGLFRSTAYLRNSTFTLDLGGDVAWSDAWYAHPDGFGNTLGVGGQIVPTGRRTAYDATKQCPPDE